MNEQAMSQQELHDALAKRFRKGTRKLVFKKKNGDVRTMEVTLDPELVPQEHAPKGNSSKPKNYELLTLYSVGDKGWRAPRIDSLIEPTVEQLLEETPAE